MFSHDIRNQCKFLRAELVHVEKVIGTTVTSLLSTEVSKNSIWWTGFITSSVFGGRNWWVIPQLDSGLWSEYLQMRSSKLKEFFLFLKDRICIYRYLFSLIYADFLAQLFYLCSELYDWISSRTSYGLCLIGCVLPFQTISSFKSVPLK